MGRPVFPPNPPTPPLPPGPGSPTQQPTAPASGGTASPLTPGVPPSQPVDTRTRPNLRGLVHPQVELAIRNLFNLAYDAGDGVKAFVNQMIGGAMALATVSAGVISAQVTSGGYYQSVPIVTIATDGNGYSATAIVTGNRVTGLTIVQGTGATHATISFNP